MSAMSKVKKRVVLMAHVARRTPWMRVLRQRDRSSELVIWLHHRYPESWLQFLAKGDSFLNDAALVNAVVETGRSFRFVSGANIGDLVNSTVVYSIGEFNPARSINYSASLVAALRQLEAQGNTLYPSADEAEYWENKMFMHRRFDDLGITAPPTVLVDRDTDLGPALADAAFEFPLLVKEPHSCQSQGLHKVDSMGDLERVRSDLARGGNYEFIVQRILDMRRDLRVTMIGGKIVHHYFRINFSEEWKPTTTRAGSQADFETFPEHWRGRIEEAMAKLGMRNGAFDICWDGDDLETEPYFLEVSPAYTPNPPPPPAFVNRPYADFKAQLFGPDSFPGQFADLVFELHRQVVAAWGLGGPKS